VPWLILELAPNLAAVVEDVLVGREDAVGELSLLWLPSVAQEAFGLNEQMIECGLLSGL